MRPGKRPSRAGSRLRLRTWSGVLLPLPLAALGLGACQAAPPPGDTATRGPIEIVVAVPGAAPQERAPKAKPKSQRRAGAPSAAKQDAPHAALDAPHAAAHASPPRPGDVEAPASSDDSAPSAGPAPGPVAQRQQPAPQLGLLPNDPKERSPLLLASYAPGQAPVLLDDDGALLPQTRELPSGESEFFRQLGPALFSAIIENDPNRVLPYFMPVEVYKQLKDSKNPPRDWRYRLHAQLKRDLERYHRRLGRDRKRASYEGLELKPADAAWLEPGREYNKLPYYRLFGSQLRYRDAKGTLRHLNLSALISWRGEWYIVHLDGLR